MAGLEILITMAPVSGVMCVATFGYYLNNKRKYKKVKKKVYKYIKDAISALDFDDIIKGFELLKEFDIKHTDDDGEPQKKYFEKMLLKKRLSKSEKTEVLFGIPTEATTDINKLKKHFSDKLKKEDLEVHLEKVEEEEKKENETLTSLKSSLEKLKTRQLASHNTTRKVVDEINLTEIIKELHKEYETLFIESFQSDSELHNILQRQVKKTMIIKKMNMLSSKKKLGNLKSC
tara:strand:+ start:428 stop:1123 length:696 start_codon:yes stop_codon:yes gene_type:complete